MNLHSGFKWLLYIYIYIYKRQLTIIYPAALNFGFCFGLAFNAPMNTVTHEDVINTPLCLFCSFFISIFGAIRTGSYMTFILMTKGLKQSVCDQSFYNGPVSKFWAYAFVLSKAPELGEAFSNSKTSTFAHRFQIKERWVK